MAAESGQGLLIKGSSYLFLGHYQIRRLHEEFSQLLGGQTSRNTEVKTSQSPSAQSDFVVI